MKCRPSELDQALRAAKIIGDGEDHYREAGQQDVDAVDLKRAGEATLDEVPPIGAQRPSIMREGDRDARQEDESFRAIRKAKIARRHLLEEVSWNMVAEDRDQDDATPKIHRTDPTRLLRLNKGYHDGRASIVVEHKQGDLTRHRGGLGDKCVTTRICECDFACVSSRIEAPWRGPSELRAAAQRGSVAVDARARPWFARSARYPALSGAPWTHTFAPRSTAPSRRSC